MKYRKYCNKEVESKGEKGCYSQCGMNCNDCCYYCGRHGLTQGVIAVIDGKLTNPSWTLQMLVNEVKAGMRDVDSGHASEYLCTIEDGAVYQNSVKVNYTVKFRYTNGHYTALTSYRQ